MPGSRVFGLRRGSRVGRDGKSGAAAVEFALIAPLLIFLFWGIVSYGGYFMTAHNVQQLANDAARAAVGGLDDAERSALASECIQTEAAIHAQFQKSPPTMSLVNTGESIEVTVSYDGSKDPFWAFSMLGPMPSTIVRRSGSVLRGGY